MGLSRERRWVAVLASCDHFILCEINIEQKYGLVVEREYHMQGWQAFIKSKTSGADREQAKRNRLLRPISRAMPENRSALNHTNAGMPKNKRKLVRELLIV
jgi:hypothetical protein